MADDDKAKDNGPLGWGSFSFIVKYLYNDIIFSKS